MAVVEHCAVGAAGTDARVRLMAAAAVEGAVEEEEGLELVLEHPGARLAHHRRMRAARHPRSISHHFNLLRALAHAALGCHGVERARVNFEVLLLRPFVPLLSRENIVDLSRHLRIVGVLELAVVRVEHGRVTGFVLAFGGCSECRPQHVS